VRYIDVLTHCLAFSRNNSRLGETANSFRCCRVYRWRRPMHCVLGTLFPHVTFVSERGRTIHQSFVNVIEVAVEFLLVLPRLIPLPRLQDTSFSLLLIWCQWFLVGAWLWIC
jgi:hypothetical protein